jgi:hypothetical protein
MNLHLFNCKQCAGQLSVPEASALMKCGFFPSRPARPRSTAEPQARGGE